MKTAGNPATRRTFLPMLLLQTISMAIPIMFLFIPALAIALTGAVGMSMSDRETASLSLALYGVSGVMGAGHRHGGEPVA